MARTKSTQAALKLLKGWYVWIILLGFWVLNIIFFPEYLDPYTYRSIFLLSVPILFVALAETIVIITGGFDLSVGVVVSAATAIASVTMKANTLVGLGLVIVFGLTTGVINALGVVRARIDSFIMTLGTMFAINGLALIIRPMPGGYIDPKFSAIILYTISNIPITTFILFFAVSIIGVTLLHRRKLGREIFAIGGDREKARRAGVNVDRVEFVAYILSGVLSAIGGLILAGQVSTGDAEIGLPYLFNAFVAAVLGGSLAGVGGFLQVIPATLLMGSISSSIVFMGISSWYEFLVKGILLVAVVAIQQRIVGRRSKG